VIVVDDRGAAGARAIEGDEADALARDPAAAGGDRGREAPAADDQTAEIVDDFDHMPEVAQTTWAGISADIVAGVEEIGSPDGDRAAPSSVFTIGFCMGELGVPSRILCGKYGSPFTYASPEIIVRARR